MAPAALTSWLRVGAAAAVAVALLALVARSRAQDAGSAASGNEARARALLDEGMRKYALAEYDAAIEAFKQAFDLAPAPGLLFNIAQAYRLEGPRGCANAATFYRSYLRLAPAAANRASVEGRILEMDACAAAEAERERERREREAARVRDARAAPPAATARTTSARPERRRATPPARARSGGPGPWPFVLGGAGVIAVGTGAALWAIAGSRYSELERECATGACAPGVWRGDERMEQIGVALMAAGAAAVAAGAVWWLLASPSHEDAEVRVASGPGWVELEGAF